MNETAVMWLTWAGPALGLTIYALYAWPAMYRWEAANGVN